MKYIYTLLGIFSSLIALYAYASPSVINFPANIIESTLSALGGAGISGGIIWVMLKRLVRQYDDIHLRHEKEIEKLEVEVHDKYREVKEDTIQAVDGKLKPLTMLIDRLDASITKHNDLVLVTIDKINGNIKTLSEDVAVLKNESNYFKHMWENSNRKDN